MIKVSLKYWQNHKRMAFSVIGAVALSIASIMCCCFFVRGLHLARYESYLQNMGNYNFVVTNVSEQQKKLIEESKYFSEHASMEIWGNVESTQNKNDFLAGTITEDGQKLYHLKCEEGTYPSAKNQIAANRETFEALGVYPKVGEMVELRLKGRDGTSIKTEEFYISGILDSLSKERGLSMITEFSFPKVFIGMQDIEASECVMLLIENPNADIDEICNWLIENQMLYSFQSARIMAQVLMLTMTGELNQKNIDATLSHAQKDFESNVLIPIFSLAICGVSIISIYVAIRMLLSERKRQLDILRGLGLTRKRTLIMLVGEILVLVIVGIFAGMLLGSIGYGITLLVQKVFFHQSIYSAFWVEKIIASVTLNPYTYPLKICLESIVCVGIIFLLQNVREKEQRQTKSKKNRLYQQLKKTFVSGRSYQICTGILVTTLMMAGYFGSLYFMERTRFETQELQQNLQAMNVGNCDYSLEKNFYVSTCGVADSNRHNGGISDEDIEALEQREDVLSCRYIIEDRSAKIRIDKSESIKLHEALASAKITYSIDYLADLNQKIEEWLGYEQDNRYNIPIIGTSQMQLAELEDYLLQGSINHEQMMAGNEVILLYLTKDAKCPYQVGDIIEMTDLVKVDEKTEEFDFSTGNIPNGYEPQFYWNYVGEDGILESELNPGYVFGKRVDYTAKVAGIMYISDESYQEFYQTRSLTGNSQFQILCDMQAFQAWELPDNNITKLEVQVENPAENTSFAHFWYGMVGHSLDVTGTSHLTVEKNILKTKITYFSFFVAIFSLLMLVGLFGIINMTNRELTIKEDAIKDVRRLGITKRRLYLFFILQKVKYALIGAAFCWLPVAIFESVRIYILHNMENGKLDGIFVGVKPWYLQFPSYYRLLEQPFIRVFIGIVSGCALLLLLIELYAVYRTFRKLQKTM